MMVRNWMQANLLTVRSVLSLPLSTLVGRVVGTLAFRVPLPLVVSPLAVLLWLAIVLGGSALASALPARGDIAADHSRNPSLRLTANAFCARFKIFANGGINMKKALIIGIVVLILLVGIGLALHLNFDPIQWVYKLHGY